MPQKTIIKKNSKPCPLPIDNEKFEIPQAFLNQLNEFTEGGYILITAPVGGMPPEIHQQYDSVGMMYGMHAFARDYFASSSKNMAALTDDFLSAPTS